MYKIEWSIYLSGRGLRISIHFIISIFQQTPFKFIAVINFILATGKTWGLVSYNQYIPAQGAFPIPVLPLFLIPNS